MNPEEEQRLIRSYLGPEPGVFIEVGAHHPTSGSQTHHLARAGWRGILVEPQARLHELLRAQRPESFVVRAACTSPDQVGEITLHVPDEPENRGFATVVPNRDEFYLHYPGTERVPARTLDDIVQEWRTTSGGTDRIRFLSIDVEGYEAEVLRGFDARRHAPDLILVEDKLQDLTKVRLLAGKGYRLFRRTSLNTWYVPREARIAPAAAPCLTDRLSLYRKVYLGLPFRMLRRWRHARRRPRPTPPPA